MLKSTDQKDERQLKKLLRYVQDRKHTATEFMPNGVGPGVLKVYTVSDWAQGPNNRTSTSSAINLSVGCRSHTHSRGPPLVALLCETKSYAACEGLKKAILVKAAMGFVNTCSMNIELLVDNSATRQVCHKCGVGEQKHLEIRAI